MAKTLKQYKLKLGSKEKIEELLQEIYVEACKNIEEAQREINRISMSTDLNNEIIDGKSKYAKAINDFIATKDKAISRKLEVAKLMADVMKFNGDVQKVLDYAEVPNNWGDILGAMPDEPVDNKPINYTMK